MNYKAWLTFFLVWGAVCLGGAGANFAMGMWWMGLLLLAVAALMFWQARDAWKHWQRSRR